MLLAEDLQILGLANDHNDENQKKTTVVGEEERYPSQNIVVVGLSHNIDPSSKNQNFEKHKQYVNFQTLSPPKMKSSVKEDDHTIPMTELKIPKQEEETKDEGMKSENDLFDNTDLD